MEVGLLAAAHILARGLTFNQAPWSVRGERTHDNQASRFVRGKGSHDNQTSHERGLKSYCNLHVVGPGNFNYCRLTTAVQINKGTIVVHLSSRLWNF